jgi:hypothetical protein
MKPEDVHDVVIFACTLLTAIMAIISCAYIVGMVLHGN